MGESKVVTCESISLGKNELAIIRYLANKLGNSDYTTNIYNNLCANAENFENCKNSLKAAIRSLKKKKIIRRTKRYGKFYVYITREGKRCLLELLGTL